MFRSFCRVLMLCVSLALTASVRAQPAAPGGSASAAAMTPMERAQRDADKVFYWVKRHGNAQPRPVPAKEASVATIGAATVAKKPLSPPVRAEVAPATTASSSGTSAAEPAASVAAEPPPEPPALN